MSCRCPGRSLFFFLMLGVWGMVWPGAGHAQVPTDQQAEMTLNSARKLYQERNYPQAAARFREYLGKFPGHKEVVTGRLGLALCLLEGPEKNYNEAREQLQAAAGAKDLPEFPFILYNLGLSIRGQGMGELQLADTKPGEAPQRRANAQQRFGEAAPVFGQAAQAFLARVPADASEVTPDAEWAGRARCDQAEMLLRLQKLKEAQETAAPFLKHPILGKTKAAGQGRYFFAFTCFLLKDYPQAQQILVTLAPFADPHFGSHARYLLARTHHLADEKAEAAFHYDGAIADYRKNVEAARNLLKQPEKFKNDLQEKARLEGLEKDPPPDAISRATFYLGVLAYEAGRFGEALGRFQEFPKLYPNSPLRTDADLRIGFCQVQMKSFAEAVKTLTGLTEKEPRIADQVFFWLGKAQAGLGDPTKPDSYPQAQQTALNTLRTALDRNQKVLNSDPEAPRRRAEILLETAEVQQNLKQNKEAAVLYQQVLSEKSVPDREEEILQRLAAALHLAGNLDESDLVCKRFQEKFPRGLLLPAVLFCSAENQYFRCLALEKSPASPDRDKQLAILYTEAGKRLQNLIEKFPEFAKVNLARYTLGLTYYRQNQLLPAQKILAEIPGPERSGELGLVPYLLADIELRQIPKAIPEDALAAGKMLEQLKSVAGNLEAFIGAPVNPQTPDALLKFGLVQQRLAGLYAQPPEKQKAFASAREAYKRILKDFKDSPAMPQAILENAKIIAQGDSNQAIQILQAFTQDPLRLSKPAPMALIHLATLYRAQNKADKAAGILAQSREWHESILSKDPERTGWIPLLRYHHGVALKEINKLPEARALFETVFKQVPTQPEGMESALRFGQCLKEEGMQKLDLARKVQGSQKPEDKALFKKLTDEGEQLLRTTAQFLEKQAALLKDQEEGAETRSRLLYEAAWCIRTLAEPEIRLARQQLALEEMKKLNATSSKFPPLQIPLEKVPVQPLEKKARELYQALIDQFPDVALAADAHFELAELYSMKGEHAKALALLGEVLDREPSPELTERTRLRLGAARAAQGDWKGGLAQFEIILQNPKSPLIPEATYRAGEIHLQQGEFSQAIKRLTPFRDNPNFFNHPGLTDRALLRLGHALAGVNDWNGSKTAHERVLQVNAYGPWGLEARYGLGFALQKMNQFDPAINHFNDVVRGTASDLGARAQLQIGLCRLDQKKYSEAVTALFVVPSTYGYPEISATALLEAGRALAEANQPAEAERVWQRVIKEYANTPWAETAQNRIQSLKK